MAAIRSPQTIFALHSAVAFATAELVTVVLHELGHAYAAKAFGLAARIFPFAEVHPGGSARQMIAILAAGPLTSLFTGLLALACLSRVAHGATYVRLVVLWLAWTGIYEFVNYVIVTPWLAAGDTARVADLLHLTAVVRYGATALGFAAAFALARVAVRTMLATVPPAFSLDTPRERRRALMRGYYLPVIAGTFLVALGGIGTAPGTVALGLLGCAGNLEVPGLGMFFAGDRRTAGRREVSGRTRLEPAAFAVFAFVVVFYVAVLSRGLAV